MTIIDLQIYSIEIDESHREVIQLELDDGYQFLDSYRIPRKQILIIMPAVD